MEQTREQKRIQLEIGKLVKQIEKEEDPVIKGELEVKKQELILEYFRRK